VRRAACLALLAATAVAYGDKGDQRRANEQIRDKVEYFTKKCGGQLDAAIDFKSFAGNYKPHEDELNAAAYCGDVIESLGWICDNDQTARAPMQRIRKLRCAFDGSLGRDLGHDLKGTTLTVRLSWDTDNVGDRLKAWIENLPAGDAPAAASDDDAPAQSHGEHLSVRQSRERANAQPKLDDLVAKVRGGCGVAIPIAVDWASFEGHFGGGERESSAVGRCAQQVEQIGDMCQRNAEEKRTIARAIKGVTCHWDDSGGHGFKFALAKDTGALVVGYTWRSADSGHNLLRYLWNTLD
jgi:hypothetical protein